MMAGRWLGQDGKGGKGGGPKGGAVGTSSSDREALERAFADVKPLGENDEKACDAARRKPSSIGARSWKGPAAA